MVDILFLRTWWVWHPADRSLHALFYRNFNLVEAGLWALCGCLVLWCYAAHRRSPLELAYAAVFFTFGASDVREAYALTSWLLWLKAVNLVAIVLLRRAVIQTCYPGAKY